MDRLTKVLGVALAVAWVAGLASSGHAAAVDTAKLDQAFAALKTYDWGKDRAGLNAIDEAIVATHGDAAARKDLEVRLVEVLKSDAPRAAKDFACRKLSVIGTAACVPAVAGLLTDADLSHMARYVLERLPEESAVAAMRSALPKTSGKVRIGIINSLGVRADKGASPALVALLKDGDPETVGAAAAALGKIATPEATVALAQFKAAAPKELQTAVTDACLDAAERVLAQGNAAAAVKIYEMLDVPSEPERVRLAAFRGMVAAKPSEAAPRLVRAIAGDDPQMRGLAILLVKETPGPEATKAFADAVATLPPGGQAAMLEALGERGDVAARPAAAKAIASPDAGVRIAAAKALGALGSSSDVPVLVRMLGSADANEAAAARAALAGLKGKDVNGAIVGALAGTPAPVRVHLIGVLAARYAVETVPTVLGAAKDADAAVRGAAMDALAILADESHAAALVDFVKAAKDDAERASAEKALAALAGRAGRTCADAVLAGLSGAEAQAETVLLRALGRIGGPKALGAVVAATKSKAEAVQDEAVRVLSTWADLAAAEPLLAMAKSAPKTTHQVLALRGYVALARLKETPPDLRLRMLSEAMALAKRPDEKTLVLGGLGDCKAPEALKLVMPHLADPALANEAGAAAVRISEAIWQQDKDLVRQAMGLVAQNAKDPKTVGAAQKVLDRIGPK